MTLRLAGIEITPPLALAPMVGLSHSVLRTMIVRLGGVGLFFTEMLSAKRLPAENRFISPYLMFSPEERPLFFQIYTNGDCCLEPAVEKLERLGADGIDLNLGCPAPNLRRMRAGAALVEDRQFLNGVMRRLRSQTALPVSVKIRLGVRADRAQLLDFCRFLEDLGVDLITVHARLVGEKFCRKPRWQLLDELAGKLEVPLLVNGGIASVEDARRCLEITGADGLMIGRAAVRQPWLFREIAESLYDLEKRSTPIYREMLYFTFMELLTERFLPERRLGRLKEFTHYYAANFAFGHQLASDIQSSRSMEQARRRAEQFFTR